MSKKSSKTERFDNLFVDEEKKRIVDLFQGGDRETAYDAILGVIEAETSNAVDNNTCYSLCRRWEKFDFSNITKEIQEQVNTESAAKNPAIQAVVNVLNSKVLQEIQTKLSPERKKQLVDLYQRGPKAAVVANIRRETGVELSLDDTKELCLGWLRSKPWNAPLPPKNTTKVMAIIANRKPAIFCDAGKKVVVFTDLANQEEFLKRYLNEFETAEREQLEINDIFFRETFPSTNYQSLSDSVSDESIEETTYAAWAKKWKDFLKPTKPAADGEECDSRKDHFEIGFEVGFERSDCTACGEALDKEDCEEPELECEHCDKPIGGEACKPCVEEKKTEPVKRIEVEVEIKEEPLTEQDRLERVAEPEPKRSSEDIDAMCDELKKLKSVEEDLIEANRKIFDLSKQRDTFRTELQRLEVERSKYKRATTINAIGMLIAFVIGVTAVELKGQWVAELLSGLAIAYFFLKITDRWYFIRNRFPRIFWF